MHQNIRQFSLLENERNYRNHITRLHKIANDKKLFSNKQKGVDEHDFRLYMQQDSQHRKNAKQQSKIELENNRILGKLLNINLNHEKKASPTKKPLDNKDAQVNLKVGRTKSLNAVNRKLDIIKIVNENVRLTERIIFQESAFSRAKLEREYKKNREYSDRIRKVRVKADKTLEIGHSGIRLSPGLRIKNQISYLPPLQAALHASIQPQRMIYRSNSVPRLQNEGRSISSAVPGPRTNRIEGENSTYKLQHRDGQDYQQNHQQKDNRSQSLLISQQQSAINLENSDSARVQESDEAFQTPEDDEYYIEPVVSQDQLLLIQEVDARRKPSTDDADNDPEEQHYLLASKQNEQSATQNNNHDKPEMEDNQLLDNRNKSLSEESLHQPTQQDFESSAEDIKDS